MRSIKNGIQSNFPGLLQPVAPYDFVILVRITTYLMALTRIYLDKFVSF